MQMTERERLIELFEKFYKDINKTCPHFGEVNFVCDDCAYSNEFNHCDYELRKIDYLLNNGIVVLPCKVGDVVYFPHDGQIDELKVVCFVKYGYTTAAFFNAELTESCEICNFGKIVFLTKEDAEKALAEKEQAKCGKNHDNGLKI